MSGESKFEAERRTLERKVETNKRRLTKGGTSLSLFAHDAILADVKKWEARLEQIDREERRDQRREAKRKEMKDGSSNGN